MWQKLVNVDEAKIWYPDPSKVDVQRLDAYILNNIEKDIPRTFPNHEIFRDENSDGQNALRNVLRWYAVLDGAVNYCQGMSFTAGVFLTVLPEREAYYCFTSALQKRALRSMYLPGLVDLMRRCHVHMASRSRWSPGATSRALWSLREALAPRHPASRSATLTAWA